MNRHLMKIILVLALIAFTAHSALAVTMTEGTNSIIFVESIQGVELMTEGTHQLVMGVGLSGTLTGGAHVFQLMPPFPAAAAASTTTSTGGGGGGGDLTLDARCQRLGGTLVEQPDGSVECIVPENQTIMAAAIAEAETFMNPLLEFMTELGGKAWPTRPVAGAVLILILAVLAVILTQQLAATGRVKAIRRAQKKVEEEDKEEKK